MDDSVKCGRPYWLRISVVNVLAAVVVVVVFSGITWRTPARDVARAFAISLLFSFCIGTLVAAVMPRVAGPIWRRFGFTARWVVASVVMVAIAIVGISVTIAILAALGVVPVGQLAQWFAGSLKISLVVTLTFGLFMTAAEVMRSELDEATLALRTTERDEAHARQVAAEAQLASLESRVHPHFLFNTLNSIAALIPQDPAGAERVVGNLASLLRFSLDLKPLVTVGSELEIVRDYLEIERVRFGERLRYRIDADPAADAALVPRLSLQTLVENSVKYAVSTRREGASIVVGAAVEGSDVAVVVADDGPGFEPAIPEGHGLALLRSRLAAQFGDRASLHIGCDGAWTRVRLTMPLVRQEVAVR